MKLRSDPSEFQQLVLLQSFRERRRIEIAVGGRRIFERFVVFLLNVEFIEGIVDGFNVSRLDGDEVRFDKGNVV